MARVIGVDFGNWNAFVCFVNNMNASTRMGGTIIDLMPDRYRELGQSGIPNEFFWGISNRDGKENEFLGFEAARDSNYPAENHLRLLKRNIGGKKTLYGDAKKTISREFNYDDLIIKAFSYVVSLANESLRETFGEEGTTNLISVTYPASLSSPSALRYFVDLAEQADSGARDEKGNMLKIKVVGTTSEPAAAGLDRLSEQREDTVKEVETFGVCDFGGGTYDLSIVALYPKGRKYANGATYYFAPVCEDEKGMNVGGNDFSAILEDLFNNKLKEEIGREPSVMNKRLTKRNVERCKVELSAKDTKETVITYEIDDDVVEIYVKREEFEEAIASKVKEVMNRTAAFFAENKNCKPDGIIMTGGTFFIPYIQQELEKALPEFAGKISLHKPSKAAAHGAARFYNPVPEKPAENTQETEEPSIVRKVLTYDITTKIKHNGEVQMDTLLTKGTELPCESGERVYSSVLPGADSTDYSIYKSNKANPVKTKVNEDYDLVEDATLNHPNEPETEKVSTHCTVSVDSLGLLRLKAWTENDDNIKIDHKVQLK